MQTCLMFPGQGSPVPGMGRLVSPFIKDLFQKASSINDLDWEKLCTSLEVQSSSLVSTSIQQMCIFLTSLGYWRKLEKADYDIRWILGHSLGEYTALVASGILEAESLLPIVWERGLVMEEAPLGGMCVMWGDGETATSAAQSCGLFVANENGGNQWVLSGSLEGIERLKTFSFRTQQLAVSGPFHSPYMKKSAERLKTRLMSLPYKPTGYNFIPNVTGVPTQNYHWEYLFHHFDHPVLWETSLREAWKGGARCFIDMGPGRVLRGLAKRILPQEAKLLSLVDEEIKAS